MMIDARELRIGNYLFYRGEKEANVSSIGSNGFETTYIGKDQPNGSTDLDEYKPIPLTEEWLLRFGLYPDEDGDYLIAEVYFSFNIGVLSVADDYYYGFLPKIQSVHQLQNLHFALTKQELKLNDK